MGERRWRSLPAFSAWTPFGEVFVCLFPHPHVILLLGNGQVKWNTQYRWINLYYAVCMLPKSNYPNPLCQKLKCYGMGDCKPFIVYEFTVLSDIPGCWILLKDLWTSWRKCKIKCRQTAPSWIHIHRGSGTLVMLARVWNKLGSRNLL